MGFLDIFIGKKDHMTADERGWHDVFSGSKYNSNLVELYDIAYSNIRLIRDRASVIPLKVVRRSNSDMEVDNHWLKVLLNDPNKEDSPKSFIKSLISSSLVFDETYIMFDYSTKTKLTTPVNMYVISPMSIEIKVDPKTNEFKNFQYKSGVDAPKDLQPKQILQFKQWSPLSTLRGISPLSSAKDYLKIEQAMALYQQGFFSSPIPSGAFVIEADKAVFDNTVKNIKENHINQNKSNAIQFFRKAPGKNANIEFIKYQQENRNLALGELFTILEKKIDDAFGVPKEMKGDVTATNLAGVKVAERVFLQNVVVPLVDDIVDRFNNWLFNNFPNEDVAVAYESPVSEDQDKIKTNAEVNKLKAETISTLVNAGVDISTISEITEIENLNFVPVQVQKQIETKSKKTDYKALILNKKNVDVSGLDGEFIRQLTPELRREFYLHLKSLNIDVQDLIDQDQNIDNIDINAQSEALLLLLLPSFIKALDKGAVQQAALIDAKLPEAIRLTQASPQIKNAYSIYLRSILSGWHTDTAVELGNIQATAKELQWSKPTLRKEIRNYFTKQGDYIREGSRTVKNNAVFRADRLVNTEIQRANNYASIDSMEQISNQLGVKVEKVWARTGISPEPICDSLNGRTISITDAFWSKGSVIEKGGRSFSNNWLDVQAPPAHPQCLLPDMVVKSDKISAITKFDYSGRIYIIKTSSGRIIKVTPNHLILTDQGFVPAHKIVKGSKVLTDKSYSVSSFSKSNPDTNQKIPTIGDLFDSIANSIPMSTTGMPITAEYFKGDGRFGKGDVDIINVDSLLRGDTNTEISKLINKNLFQKIDFGDIFDSYGFFDKLFTALACASDGVVSFSSDSLTLLNGSSNVPNLLGFTATPDYKTRISELGSNSLPRNTSGIANIEDAFSAIVETDNVVDLFVSDYFGHVYDVSSQSTLYSANGIFTSNCQCEIKEYIIKES